ncbi:MAG: hypothetical protein GC129_03145 [Proteobacteria bacterium]|nr:hypothetical protein [Pseudomonadota bacterium]
MKRLLGLCALGLAMAANALAHVSVDTAAGKVVVKVDAPRLVAWQPDHDHMVILADGTGDVEIEGLPTTWQGDYVYQNGMHGISLKGQMGGWSVLQQGNQWLVREGEPAQKKVGALLLKDGWRVDGKAVARRQIDLDGKSWVVATVPSPEYVDGSVVGAVKAGTLPGGGSEVSAKVEGGTTGGESDVSKITVVKKPAAEGMAPVSVGQMLAKLEPASGDVQKVAPKLEAPAGVVSAAVVQGDEGKVATHGAEAIAATPTPKAEGEAVMQAYPVGEVDGIYVPGTLVSVTVPADILRGGETHGARAQVPPVSEEEVDGAVVEQLFPAREGDYTTALSERMHAVAEASTTGMARDAKRDLVAFYLAWQRPQEAIGVMQTMDKREDGLPADGVARLYWGLAQLAMHQEGTAHAFDQGGALAPHAQLWRAVAAAEREDYGVALKEWPRQRGILPQYPDYLRAFAQQAQATSLVMVGDKKVAGKVVDTLVSQYPVGQAPAALVRLQGLVRMGTPDEREGLNDLASAAEATKVDPVTAYRAKFEFVRMLAQRHEISDAQEKNYLEQLWLDWRGDGLERDVLGVLADLYEKAGEPREALERWQTLVRAYPNIPDLNAVTDRMTQAFVDVFDPENPRSYDTLTYLGLYYDFRELVPNDVRGDSVQEAVAKMLADNTLWARAAPILEQQLAYRPLDRAAQGRLALLLAEVYRREGRAGDALKLLDKWEKVASGTDQQRAWKLAQAEALMDLGHYDSAKRALQGVEGSQALQLRVDADWQLKNWSGAADGLKQALDGVTDEMLAKDSEAQLDLFRLAYAYGQMKDGDALEKLQARYEKALAGLPKLADGVNAVAAGTGIASTEGGGVMAPLTGALADINSLTDQVNALRAQRKKVLEEREDYDNKMKYMELLPPPVI